MGPGAAPARVTVLACAHNEEANIRRFLDAVLRCQGDSFELLEVVVVASGCTDRTVPILQEVSRLDPRVRVVIQPERLGKASAMRLGLAESRGDIICVAGADTVPSIDSLEQLARPFRDSSVGLVCAHLVPCSTDRNLTEQIAAVAWEIHDRVSQLAPKTGETFAFRRQPIDMPEDVQDDDTYLGAAVLEGGLTSVYSREAVVYNRAPSRFADLYQQRLRIDRQVLGLRRRTGITSVTWRPGVLVRAVLSYLKDKPENIAFVAAMAAIELIARTEAVVVTLVRRAPLKVWDPIRSTKDAIRLPARLHSDALDPPPQP